MLLQEQSSSYAQGPKGAGMNRLALWTGDCSWRVGGKRKGKVFEFSSQPLKCCKTMLILHYTNVIGTWKRLSLRTAVETRGPDLDKVLVCVCQAVVKSSFLCVPCASVAPVTVLNWVILWRGLMCTPDTAWDTSHSKTTRPFAMGMSVKDWSNSSNSPFSPHQTIILTHILIATSQFFTS